MWQDSRELLNRGKRSAKSGDIVSIDLGEIYRGGVAVVSMLISPRDVTRRIVQKVVTIFRFKTSARRSVCS